MAKSTPERILIESRDGSIMTLETTTGEAGIGPGDLLEFDSSGEVLRHNGAAGAVVPVMVALEKWWNDDDDDVAIDVDYADGDVCRVGIPQSGDVVYMWLASGENAAINAYLQSDGDGALAVLATYDATTVGDSVVGRAVAAVNATGGISRIKVRIA